MVLAKKHKIASRPTENLYFSLKNLAKIHGFRQKIKKLHRVQLKIYIFLFKNLAKIHGFSQKSKNCVVSSGKCIF